MDLLKEYNKKNFPYKKETYKIIGCAMEVHAELGHGFLESVYQEALSIVFDEKSIPYEQEKILKIFFRGKTLKKTFQADFFCYDNIIVETKAAKELTNKDLSQVLNYLKATDKELGLLINFGTEHLQYKRIIRTKDNKKSPDYTNYRR
ncbi:MAG: GxxExxY protein [Campylobacteraceae bacterium]|nr:GxxExxY protein [Campylobacteraceae bacterium]